LRIRQDTHYFHFPCISYRNAHLGCEARKQLIRRRVALLRRNVWQQFEQPVQHAAAKIFVSACAGRISSVLPIAHPLTLFLAKQPRGRQPQRRRFLRRNLFKPIRFGRRNLGGFGAFLLDGGGLSAGKTPRGLRRIRPEWLAHCRRHTFETIESVNGERMPRFDADRFCFRIFVVSLLRAANIQPVARARRGDVEISPVFFVRACGLLCARRRAQRNIIAL